MAKPELVVLYFNEDGDPPQVHTYTREAFLKDLNEENWGPDPAFASPGVDTATFSGLLVIEGRIVQPRPTQVVKEWGL